MLVVFELILAFRSQIASGSAKFADIASKESDCSSAKRGGDLGPFGRGKMQRLFLCNSVFDSRQQHRLRLHRLLGMCAPY